MLFDSKKKTLVIVESPTKAKTIGKYLPKNFTLIASKGHVRDLPQDRMGIDVEKDFQPEYVITEDKRPLISDIKKKLAVAEQLLLATDEDREGESISWHLLEVLKPKVPYQRMVFHEITKKAIAEALDKGRGLDMQLVGAQEDRRIIDRLYGYEVSPVLWRRLSNKKLSGGRVQSVGLRFLVDKEMDRMSFQSSTYFDIEAKLKREEGESPFTAKLESIAGERIATSKDFDSDTGVFNGKSKVLNEEEVTLLAENCRKQPFVVESVIQKPTRVNPYPPFTTSTLQIAANARLRMSAKETMRTAQSLFEHGFITYMRTDSTLLSSECIHASRSEIEKDFGKEFLSDTPRQFANKNKMAQEAHEAIRPSGDTFRRPEECHLAGRELSLYTLIWQRTLATQMAPAEKSTTSVKIASGDALFSASGTTIIFPGFLKVYGADSDDGEKEGSLPRIDAGAVLSLSSLEEKSHVTQPPARYTEASLVKKLEEKGIGRPSTYATIISTLLDRGYAIEQGNALVPTFIGFAVYQFLHIAFPSLVEYSYTSDMENYLDKIANGEYDRIRYLHDFYDGPNGLEAMVSSAKAGKEDVKTLIVPSLSGKADVGGDTVTYQTKVGPYGAYFLTDRENEEGKPIIVNIPDKYCPGTISDDDVASLITSALGPKDAEDEPGKVYLKEGRRGQYWVKDGKSCNVPRGKKKGEEYTPEEIDFLFSLPLKVATSADGFDINLNNGPYGGYLSCNGKNFKVFGALKDVTEEKALAIVEAGSKVATGPLLELKNYKDKPLAVMNGKYGAYLKWGDVNYKLSKENLEKPESLTQSEAEAIVDADPDKKPATRRRFVRKK